MSKLFGKSPKSSTASNVSETSSETGQSALNKVGLNPTIYYRSMGTVIGIFVT